MDFTRRITGIGDSKNYCALGLELLVNIDYFGRIKIITMNLHNKGKIK